MEYEVLKSAILQVLQVYKKEIFIDSTFEHDLGADSIDLAQIFGIVEKELDIHIEPVDLSKVVTVSDALEIVKATVKGAGK